MYWTTLEISAPRCALMCYPSSNITYCIACLLCIGVILLNKFNSIQFNSILLNKFNSKRITVGLNSFRRHGNFANGEWATKKADRKETFNARTAG